MTNKAAVPAQYDSLTAQETFNVTGNGSLNFLGVPQNQPSGSRSFRVLNALFFISSTNVNGTVDKPYPYDATAAGVEALAFVVPTQRVNPGEAGAQPWSVTVPFPLASLGAGVEISQVGPEHAAAGDNQIIFALESNREVIVPFGYNFGVWVSDSGDGTPHKLTVTMFAQIQWLEQPCAC